jgi:hypothetical protein
MNDGTTYVLPYGIRYGIDGDTNSSSAAGIGCRESAADPLNAGLHGTVSKAPGSIELLARDELTASFW